MDLDTLYSSTAQFWRRTSHVWQMEAGGKVSIRAKPAQAGWDELLDATVPEGKRWTIEVTVHVDEASAP